MIYKFGGYPRIRRMTNVAGTAGHNVIHGFSTRIHVVMAGAANGAAGQLRMVERLAQRRPLHNGMARVTTVSRCDMTKRFRARAREAAVMAGGAHYRPSKLRVVYPQRRAPYGGAMALFTCSGGQDVGRGFAGC